MQTTTSPPTVKVIGANGQISLGKQFAGRQVLVEEQESGVWLDPGTATVIPDNERWLHEPSCRFRMVRAMAWSQEHPATDAQTDAIVLATLNPTL